MEKNKKIIRLSKSSIDTEEVKAVKKVLKREYLGMGEEVNFFEKEIKKFIGGKGRVICVNSGTAALHLAIQSIDIKAGDEIIVPSLTYVASFQAISATGAKPVPCDVNKNNLMINIDDLKKRITKKTRAIMPIHYAGSPAELKILKKIALDHNLRVIEDAAHAFGSIYNGKKIGSFGDLVCFSFDGIKNITSGEGGAVVVFNKKDYENISDARLLGVKKDSIKRYQKKRSWEFDVIKQGWRYHMSDIMAAIGRTQLKKFNKFSSKRKKIAKYYKKRLQNLEGIHLLDIDYKNSVPHIFVVIIKNRSRDKLRKHLLSYGIETGIHWKPNHLLSKFKSNYKLKNTEEIYKKIITLPCHVDLTSTDQDYIVKKISEFINVGK